MTRNITFRKDLHINVSSGINHSTYLHGLSITWPLAELNMALTHVCRSLHVVNATKIQKYYGLHISKSHMLFTNTILNFTYLVGSYMGLWASNCTCFLLSFSEPCLPVLTMSVSYNYSTPI